MSREPFRITETKLICIGFEPRIGLLTIETDARELELEGLRSLPGN